MDGGEGWGTGIAGLRAGFWRLLERGGWEWLAQRNRKSSPLLVVDLGGCGYAYGCGYGFRWLVGQRCIKL